MGRRPIEAEPIRVTAEELAAELTRLCPEHSIDLAGAVALPGPLPHEADWLAFVNEGRHGDLDYLIREPEDRADPTRKNPWARSLLVFAQRYTAGWNSEDEAPVSGGPKGNPDDPWTDRVARYARGLDYHDVFLKDIKRVVKGLQGRWPGLVAFPSTDTGPYLERENAWLAGLGFLGKNTCLIHEKLGSGMFLGVAPTNLEVAGLPRGGQPAAEPLYAVTVPDRCPVAHRRHGRGPVPVDLDHRVAWPSTRRARSRPGRDPLRVRHLSGRMPLEPACGRRRSSEIRIRQPDRTRRVQAGGPPGNERR